MAEGTLSSSPSPKKITQWQELAGQQHGQGLAHACGEAGEDVVPLLLANSSAGDVGLQLPYFQWFLIMTVNKSQDCT